LGLERAQRVAGDDAAHSELLGEVLLGAKEVARPQLLGEQRTAERKNVVVLYRRVNTQRRSFRVPEER
jgi:hypothetical protein